MPGQFNAFDTVTVNANGFPAPLINATITAKIVGGATLPSVTSDEFGNVKGQNFAAANVGDLIEFGHATYTRKFYRKLAATSAEAADLVDNIQTTFVLQNLGTERVATEVEFWARDTNNPEAVDIQLGIGRTGATNEFKYVAPPTVQTLKIYANPIAKTGERGKLRYEDASSFNLNISNPSLELSGLTVTAGEALAARDLVHLYNDAGTIKARQADATDNTRPAEGFVDAASTLGASTTVYFSGKIISGFSGLTPGAMLFLSETAGGVTHTPITTGAGKVSQQVGQALSATSMIFEPHMAVELNS